MRKTGTFLRNTGNTGTPPMKSFIFRSGIIAVNYCFKKPKMLFVEKYYCFQVFLRLRPGYN